MDVCAAVKQHGDHLVVAVHACVRQRGVTCFVSGVDIRSLIKEFTYDLDTPLHTALHQPIHAVNVGNVHIRSVLQQQLWVSRLVSR